MSAAQRFVAQQEDAPWYATGVIADFDLPPELEAAEPPEARGLPSRRRAPARVGPRQRMSIEHARFADLPRWLAPGDLLVVNTSGTMNAALACHDRRRGGRSSCTSLRNCPADSGPSKLRMPGCRCVASVRRCARRHDVPTCRRRAGHALAPYPFAGVARSPHRVCGWRRSAFPMACRRTSTRYGFPIRYGYVKEPWPSVDVSDRVRD